MTDQPEEESTLPAPKAEGPVLSEAEGPPLFNGWRQWYWLVALVMFTQLLVYFLITRSFA